MICPHCNKEIQKKLQIPNVVSKSKKIIQAISDYYGVSLKDMVSKKRYPKIVRARHTACYMLSKWCDIPHEAVSKSLGGKDHCLSVYANKQVRTLLDQKGLGYQDISYLDGVCEEICYGQTYLKAS